MTKKNLIYALCGLLLLSCEDNNFTSSSTPEPELKSSKEGKLLPAYAFRPRVLFRFNPDLGETPESIVIDSRNNIYISMALSGEIRKITPSGKQTSFATLNIGEPFDPTTGVGGLISAMTIDAFNNIYLNVRSGISGNTGVWKVTPSGQTTLIGPLPDGAFPNGIALRNGNLYMADSFLGLIWTVPVIGGTAQVWLDHPLLKLNPSIPFPGPNGLQIFRNEVFVVNSNSGNIIAIPLRGNRPGEPRIHANAPCDDFSFDVFGNLYCGTDPFNTVLRIRQNGTVEEILNAADGLDGPTATYFGRHGLDRFNMYISNAAFPFFSTRKEASLMRVFIGVPGAPR